MSLSPEAFPYPLPTKLMTEAQAASATQMSADLQRLMRQPALALLWQQSVNAAAMFGQHVLGAPDVAVVKDLRAKMAAHGILERLVKHHAVQANEAANADRPRPSHGTGIPRDEQEAAYWMQRAGWVRALKSDPSWPVLALMLATLAYAHADMAQTTDGEAVLMHNAMRSEIEGLCETLNEWEALGPEAERWSKERGEGEESQNG